jgi:hypothetical protein
MTNLIILSIVLTTNSQQAIVGESNGKALVATQEIVAQRVELGYMQRGKPISIGDFSRVIGTPRLITNAVPFAFTPRPPAPATNATVAVRPSTNAPATINTNSPGYQRRLEREQRMRPATNAPPQQTK